MLMSINTAAKELKHKPHKHNLTQHSESTPSDEDQSERSEKNSFHISYFISRIPYLTQNHRSSIIGPPDNEQQQKLSLKPFPFSQALPKLRNQARDLFARTPEYKYRIRIINKLLSRFNVALAAATLHQSRRHPSSPAQQTHAARQTHSQTDEQTNRNTQRFDRTHRQTDTHSHSRTIIVGSHYDAFQ